MYICYLQLGPVSQTHWMTRDCLCSTEHIIGSEEEECDPVFSPFPAEVKNEDKHPFLQITPLRCPLATEDQLL